MTDTTTPRLEYTFAMIKGASVARGHTDNILTNISRRGYSILWAKRFDFTPETLREFYAEHVGHPYWANIEKVMMAPEGNVAFIAQPSVFVRNPAISTCTTFRTIVGESSNPGMCGPTTIRGIFGGCWWGGDPSVYADNAIHASDSDEAVTREIGLIYPEGVFLNG